MIDVGMELLSDSPITVYVSRARHDDSVETRVWPTASDAKEWVVERVAPDQNVTWTANGGEEIGEAGGSIIGSVAEAEIMNAHAIAQLIENSGRPASQHIDPHD